MSFASKWRERRGGPGDIMDTMDTMPLQAAPRPPSVHIVHSVPRHPTPAEALKMLQEVLERNPGLYVRFYALEPEPLFALQHPRAVGDDTWRYAFSLFLRAASEIGVQAHDVAACYGLPRMREATSGRWNRRR